MSFCCFRKVQKYIGLKGRAPKISSLNTTTWKEVKKRVKEDAQKVAKEILQAAALRSAHKADILLGNEHLEREFADSFPYQETDDQTQAINEILQDVNYLWKKMDKGMWNLSVLSLINFFM